MIKYKTIEKVLNALQTEIFLLAQIEGTGSASGLASSFKILTRRNKT